MAKKNKQQIKFEADITGLKKGIKEGEESIRSLTKELKLNQEQLKGSKDNTDLLTTKLKTLQEQYDKQTKVVEQCNEAYEKAKEDLGENSEEAKKWKDRLVEAETKQQKIKNAIDETNKELKIQTDRLITNGKHWQETGDKIVKVGEKINSVGNKLSVVSAGTAAIATAALKASIDYESAFAGVRKTVDGTEEQLQAIRQGILDMSTELPSSATEIAAVAEAAGQLGIKTDDILEFTRVMIDLGESTNLSSTEAASNLAKFANVTGMTADKYSNLGSVVVALGNNFATTEADIVSMATNLAASGELAGLSEPQIMALATAMSSVGIEAQAGGSAMSKLLKKLQIATEVGTNQLDGLNFFLKNTGYTVDDVGIAISKGGKTLENFSKKVGLSSKDLKKWYNDARKSAQGLEDFADIAGMTADEFKQAFKKDAVTALTAFITGLNDTERNGRSAIAILEEMDLTEVRLSNTILSLANSSDVMKSAIDLANESWNENTALNKEATTRYKTTESQIKMLKNEATKLAIEFGDELAPSLRKLVKDAKPMLTNISNMIKKFSQLDDATKKNIIKLGAFVVALGPTVKAIGGVTSAVGIGVKSFGIFAQAIGNVRKGTSEGSESVKTLTKLFEKMPSSLGTTTLAVTSLVAAYTALVYYTHQSSRASQEALEETKRQVAAQNELVKSYDDSKDAVFSEMNNVRKLSDELETLVDENGKVKEGYEQRVSFIVNQLNSALGTEFEITDGVIQKYKELKESVDEVIRVKKIEALMEAEEGKYNEAIKNKTETYAQIISLTDEVAKKQEALNKAEEEYNKNNQLLSGSGVRAYYYNKLDNAKKDLKNTQDNLNAQKSMYNEQLQFIRQYENDLVIAESGATDEINELILRRTTSYTKATDDIAGTLQQQIENQLYDLSITKQYLEDSINSHDEAAKKECEIQKESQEKQLKMLADNLVAMTSTTESMTPAQVKAWSQLATQSYDTYAIALSQLDDETAKKIQEATGQVIINTTLPEEFKNLGDRGIEGFKNNDFMGAGQSAAEDIASGMTSRSGLFSKVGEIFSQRLKIIASVSTEGSSGGHADGLAYVPYNNYIARLHEGERVLTKRENQDYTRNINNNSQNVVVNIYPQTMTEQEMVKVSNFIEREWGRRS